MPSAEEWEQLAQEYDKKELEANERGDEIAGELYHHKAAAARYSACYAPESPLPTDETT